MNYGGGHQSCLLRILHSYRWGKQNFDQKTSKFISLVDLKLHQYLTALTLGISHWFSYSSYIFGLIAVDFSQIYFLRVSSISRSISWLSCDFIVTLWSFWILEFLKFEQWFSNFFEPRSYFYLSFLKFDQQVVYVPKSPQGETQG